MESNTTRGNIGAAEIEVGLAFHSVIDFDKRALRKALREGAAEVRRAARRIVSRKAVSSPGEAPGLQSGELRRAIGVVTRGSRGGWIKVGVKKTAAMRFYYPAPLFYGSEKTGLAARDNYIVRALDARRENIRARIRDALKHSLVPR